MYCEFEASPKFMAAGGVGAPDDWVDVIVSPFRPISRLVLTGTAP